VVKDAEDVDDVDEGAVVVEVVALEAFEDVVTEVVVVVAVTRLTLDGGWLGALPLGRTATSMSWPFANRSDVGLVTLVGVGARSDDHE
jgi:hypothetical protein